MEGILYKLTEGWKKLVLNPKIGVFPPKWMVKIIEFSLLKMDGLGVPPFKDTPICISCMSDSMFRMFRMSMSFDLIVEGFFSHTHNNRGK